MHFTEVSGAPMSTLNFFARAISQTRGAASAARPVPCLCGCFLSFIFLEVGGGRESRLFQGLQNYFQRLTKKILQAKIWFSGKVLRLQWRVRVRWALRLFLNGNFPLKVFRMLRGQGWKFVGLSDVTEQASKSSDRSFIKLQCPWGERLFWAFKARLRG